MKTDFKKYITRVSLKEDVSKNKYCAVNTGLFNNQPALSEHDHLL